MKIQENISLKSYNTFGIDVIAKRFVSVSSLTELEAVISNEKDVFLLSGGSNMLLTKNIEKLVVHIDIKGVFVNDASDDFVLVTAEAGENWHEFVQFCIANDYGGLENLSLIPGNVGTSPIQNIGAYGVEIKDTFQQLEALHIASGEMKTFKLDDCNFGYRNSVFKNELKGQYIITSVTFKLTKRNHRINTSYGAIQQELGYITNPTLKDISNAVIAIRQSKLPDPNEIGNSGSFFKNPVISKAHFEELQVLYPNIPSYKISETEIKVPAGWLIEQAGFKGRKYGEAGVHEKQALVLVNYGTATGKEIYAIAQKIQQAIVEKYKISLEIEVNVV